MILRLVEGYAPLWLAALLGAAVMAAVMASDSQILALSTMFTEDVFAFYGGKRRFGEAVQVRTGRIFVILLTLVAYLHRAAHAAVDLRPGDAVRLCRLRRAFAAAGRGALLERQHEVGRARQHALDAPAVLTVAVVQTTSRRRRRERAVRSARSAAPIRHAGPRPV